MSKDALPIIRTFDFGGIPMVEMPHLANVGGRQLAEIIVRCLAHNHPDLVHPDAPQLSRQQHYSDQSSAGQIHR